MESKFKVFDNFESSTISKLWYSKEDSQLIVEYNGGAQYRYNDVNQVQWNNLISAQSKGKFLNQSIKSKPYQKMMLKD